MCENISIHALRAEGDVPSCVLQYVGQYFYPRPPCGGRHCPLPGCFKIRISIHALRAEGDALCCCFLRWYKISIHALRAEGDADDAQDVIDAIEFLSTPSVRRATAAGFVLRLFFPFLSTPSVRRATQYEEDTGLIHDISIHALRAEGDAGFCNTPPPLHHFYPRPPCGGRPGAAS